MKWKHSIYMLIFIDILGIELITKKSVIQKSPMSLAHAMQQIVLNKWEYVLEVITHYNILTKLYNVHGTLNIFKCALIYFVYLYLWVFTQQTWPSNYTDASVCTDVMLSSPIDPACKIKL